SLRLLSHFVHRSLHPFPTRRSSDLAYTQYGDLPLMQLVSVTGLAGIVFLMAWSASVTNHAWDRGWAPEAIRSFALPYAVVFIVRSEEHTSELQSRVDLVCRLLLGRK